jgi:hypothetical protein
LVGDDSKCAFIEENSVSGGGTHTQEKCKTIKKSKPRQEITLKNSAFKTGIPRHNNKSGNVDGAMKQVTN